VWNLGQVRNGRCLDGGNDDRGHPDRECRHTRRGPVPLARTDRLQRETETDGDYGQYLERMMLGEEVRRKRNDMTSWEPNCARIASRGWELKNVGSQELNTHQEICHCGRRCLPSPP
jgi:hypothetical protein